MTNVSESTKPHQRLGVGDAVRMLIVVFIFGWVVVFLFGPALESPSSRPMPPCRRNLKQLTIALHNYHEEFRCLPPAWTEAEDGTRLHSWRTLLLPYMGHENLYKQIRLDEPWDSVHNGRIATEFRTEVAKMFRCPNAPAEDKQIDNTSYLTIVGPQTVSRTSKRVSFRDIVDGSSNTVWVIEVASSNIHWMEPRDIPIETLRNKPNGSCGTILGCNHLSLKDSQPTESFNVAYADGSTGSMLTNTSVNQLTRLVVIDDDFIPDKNAQ